jgi:iron transport multicopper oxidase
MPIPSHSQSPPTNISFPPLQAPLELQRTLSIPPDHYSACNAPNAYPKFQTQGNAAGRTTDLLNLDGAPVSPAPLPEGFTARGIVALVFSILAALLGIAAVAWYGVGELAQGELSGGVAAEK